MLVGIAPARTGPRQLTLFKNNAGQRIADVAIAARVYERARQRGLGLQLPLDVWSAHGHVRGQERSPSQ